MRPPYARPSLVRVLLTLVAVTLGVAAVVAGEADDSPGLQMIGQVLVVGVLAHGLRTLQRDR